MSKGIYAVSSYQIFFRGCGRAFCGSLAVLNKYKRNTAMQHKRPRDCLRQPVMQRQVKNHNVKKGQCLRGCESPYPVFLSLNRERTKLRDFKLQSNSDCSDRVMLNQCFSHTHMLHSLCQDTFVKSDMSIALSVFSHLLHHISSAHHLKL